MWHEAWSVLPTERRVVQQNNAELEQEKEEGSVEGKGFSSEDISTYISVTIKWILANRADFTNRWPKALGTRGCVQRGRLARSMREHHRACLTHQKRNGKTRSHLSDNGSLYRTFAN